MDQFNDQKEMMESSQFRTEGIHTRRYGKE